MKRRPETNHEKPAQMSVPTQAPTTRTSTAFNNHTTAIPQPFKKHETKKEATRNAKKGKDKQEATKDDTGAIQQRTEEQRPEENAHQRSGGETPHGRERGGGEAKQIEEEEKEEEERSAFGGKRRQAEDIMPHPTTTEPSRS